MPAGKPFVPPGGFAGFAQQTAATQALVSRPKKKRRRKVARKRPTRRRVAKKRPARRKATATRRRRKTGRLKKGSPEAKRRMAQLRRMQRRNR